MTVEIREIVIKTEIRTQPDRIGRGLQTKNIKELKQQIIEECMHAFKKTQRRDAYDR